MADFQIFGWTASRNSHSAKSAAPAQTPSSLLLPICPSHGFLGAEVRWECSIEVERSEVVRPPHPALVHLIIRYLKFLFPIHFDLFAFTSFKPTIFCLLFPSVRDFYSFVYHLSHRIDATAVCFLGHCCSHDTRLAVQMFTLVLILLWSPGHRESLEIRQSSRPNNIYQFRSQMRGQSAVQHSRRLLS
jgi:hypothetical protein